MTGDQSVSLKFHRVGLGGYFRLLKTGDPNIVGVKELQEIISGFKNPIAVKLHDRVVYRGRVVWRGRRDRGRIVVGSQGRGRAGGG